MLSWPYWGPNTDLSVAVLAIVAAGWALGAWFALRIPLHDV